MTDAPAMGLPRSDRVRDQRAFAAVFASRRSAASGPLVIHGVQRDQERSRLGLAVGRRIGNAPQRNRVKRLLREAFRTTRHRLPAGWDFVVVVKPHAPLTLDLYARHLREAAARLAGGQQR